MVRRVFRMTDRIHASHAQRFRPRLLLHQHVRRLKNLMRDKALERKFIVSTMLRCEAVQQLAQDWVRYRGFIAAHSKPMRGYRLKIMVMDVRYITILILDIQVR